jgi:hypothetical protein
MRLHPLNLLPIFILLYSSCVTFKQFDSKAEAAREPSYEAAIVTRDGSIITGRTLKHKNYDSYDHNLVRVINKNDAFTLDGKKCSDTNVVTFQDKKAFHKRFNDLYLIRLVKGKINLYNFDNTGYTKVYSFSNGPTSSQSYNNRKSTFYFEKDGQIVTIGIGELKAAVKDNTQALQKLTAYYSKDSYSKELDIEKLTTVINIYNQ